MSLTNPPSRGDFRRGVPPRNNKKGGWRPRYSDRHDISKAETDFILLTASSYPNKYDTGNPEATYPYYVCKVHSVKYHDRGGSGSFEEPRCNIDAGQNNCVLCFAGGRSGDRRIGDPKDKFFVNILHFGLYEKVQQVDFTTKRPLVHQDGDKRGQPVMGFEVVESPRRRQEIRDNIDALVDSGDVAMYRKKYLKLGSGHFDNIAGINDLASEHCSCGGRTTTVSFTCEKCGEELAHILRDDMSPAATLAFQNSTPRCKSCGHGARPIAQKTCDSCDKPQPLTAYDVVAEVKREGEGTQSKITVRSVIPLDQFQLANGAFLIEWEKIGDTYFPKYDEAGNFIFTTDFEIKKLVEASFNFEELMTPKQHSQVARDLGMSSSPFPDEGPAAVGPDRYREYRRGGGADNGAPAQEPNEAEPPQRGRGRPPVGGGPAGGRYGGGGRGVR